MRSECRRSAGGAPLHGAALLFAEAPPDSMVDTRFQGPAQARLSHRTSGADFLGFLDLSAHRAADADRKEQLGIFFEACGEMTPVHRTTILGDDQFLRPPSHYSGDQRDGGSFGMADRAFPPLAPVQLSGVRITPRGGGDAEGEGDSLALRSEPSGEPSRRWRLGSSSWFADACIAMRPHCVSGRELCRPESSAISVERLESFRQTKSLHSR